MGMWQTDTAPRPNDDLHGLLLRLHGLHDPLQVGHAHGQPTKYHQLVDCNGNVADRYCPNVWINSSPGADGAHNDYCAMDADPQACRPLHAHEGGAKQWWS